MISNLQSNDWTPTQSRPTQIVLAKRQGSASSSIPSSSSTMPPPAQTSDSNDNGRPTTPLSVFVSFRAVTEWNDRGERKGKGDG